jgi:putative transposase
MSNKIRKKLKSTNKRINGLINELHWKSIKFLTDNYKNILIGDLSTKGIVNNKTSVLQKYNKTLSYALSFYKYRERLKYKCKVKECNYIKVSEYYTSKTCSLCANVNESLGGSKIFKCSNCNSVMDRDINGCRNIILKCL